MSEATRRQFIDYCKRVIIRGKPEIVLRTMELWPKEFSLACEALLREMENGSNV